MKQEYLLKEEDIEQLIHPDALVPFPITLPEDQRSVAVSRNQLSARFGGGTQVTFPRPRAELVAEHGKEEFMCLRMDWNPQAPPRPGCGGIFFGITLWPDQGWDAYGDHSGALTVLVRQDANKWLYMGEYEMFCGTHVSAAQWCALHKTVRGMYITHSAPERGLTQISRSEISGRWG